MRLSVPTRFMTENPFRDCFENRLRFHTPVFRRQSGVAGFISAGRAPGSLVDGSTTRGPATKHRLGPGQEVLERPLEKDGHLLAGRGCHPVVCQGGEPRKRGLLALVVGPESLRVRGDSWGATHSGTGGRLCSIRPLCARRTSSSVVCQPRQEAFVSALGLKEKQPCEPASV